LLNKTKVVFIIVAGLILAAIGIFASFSLVQRFQVNRASGVSEEFTIKTAVVVVTRVLFLGDTITGTDVEQFQ